MPAILTHYTFGLSVLDAAKGHKEAFLVGNQGPDTFMAYGTNPLNKRGDVKAIRPFGAFMHHEPIDEYYARMMAAAPEMRRLLQAIINGKTPWDKLTVKARALLKSIDDGGYDYYEEMSTTW